MNFRGMHSEIFGKKWGRKNFAIHCTTVNKQKNSIDCIDAVNSNKLASETRKSCIQHAWTDHAHIITIISHNCVILSLNTNCKNLIFPFN